MPRLFLTWVCFISLVLSASLAFAESGLQFSEAWVRQAPPSAQHLAGYGKLTNNAAVEIEIDSLKSPFFEKVEMHVSEFDHGMMKMSGMKNLVLKPGESVVFKPSGRHLMMINPLKVIKAGVIVPVIITLKSGNKYTFEMSVMR